MGLSCPERKPNQKMWKISGLRRRRARWHANFKEEDARPALRRLGRFGFPFVWSPLAKLATFISRSILSPKIQFWRIQWKEQIFSSFSWMQVFFNAIKPSNPPRAPPACPVHIVSVSVCVDHWYFPQLLATGIPLTNGLLVELLPVHNGSATRSERMLNSNRKKCLAM